VPSTISKIRLRKAFNEGRRSANEPAAENPYDNPKLRKLWDEGRRRQQAGEIELPLPPLEHGQTRAMRTPRNPPGSKRVTLRPKAPPRGPQRFGGRGGSRGGR
jgi:hypothetical protein